MKARLRHTADAITGLAIHLATAPAFTIFYIWHRLTYSRKEHK
ncbi:hypothetical protein [Trueperella pyogenes]